ncbi:hypothetical protein K1T71_008257, partial [Dendrolimus kikuchii]
STNLKGTFSLEVKVKERNLCCKRSKRLYNTWKGHYTAVEFTAHVQNQPLNASTTLLLSLDMYGYEQHCSIGLP